MRRTKMALASLFIGSTLSAEPLGQAEPLEPQCAMSLPQIKLLKSFQGPSNGPFILPEKQKDSVTLLSMNIQNLPFPRTLSYVSDINPGYRQDRMDCISKLAANFDAAAFQEDFIDRPHTMPGTWKPAFVNSDWRKILSPGLSFQSKLSFEKISAKPYAACSGWSGQANDCFANKGYQHIRLEGVDIFNTHIDAGNRDAETRKIQTEELLKAIPETGPVMLVADMNFYFTSQTDEESLSRLLKETGMTLYGRYSPQKGHDIIAARDVDIESIGIVEDRLLSDHAGLVIKFKPAGFLQARPSARKDAPRLIS